MDGIWFLSVLSAAMFVGSYIAGSIPMMFSMSESKMRMVSLFGAGLLLGTALSVIIPEGVESLYIAKPETMHAEFHGIINPAKAKAILEDSKAEKVEPPRIVPKAIEEKINRDVMGHSIARSKRDVSNTLTLVSDADTLERDKRENAASEVREYAKLSDEESHADNSILHSHRGTHQKIGFSLVLGFIFMLLVDQGSSAAWSKNDRSGRNRMGMSATIGLVVHAAADGIALGSASTTNHSDVQLIVFVAIMLHKAPAAFGLVSFLLMEGIDVRNARKHLFVFSCAAPFAAVTTFTILGSLWSDSVLSSQSSTGVLMLFSAGTFLFVATVHVLPELSKTKAVKDYMLVVDAQSPATAGHSHSSGTNFTIKELLAIVGGAIVPAVISSGHSH